MIKLTAQFVALQALTPASYQIHVVASDHAPLTRREIALSELLLVCHSRRTVANTALS
mgnify:CR=1 FL=1